MTTVQLWNHATLNSGIVEFWNRGTCWLFPCCWLAKLAQCACTCMISWFCPYMLILTSRVLALSLVIYTCTIMYIQCDVMNPWFDVCLQSTTEMLAIPSAGRADPALQNWSTEIRQLDPIESLGVDPKRKTLRLIPRAWSNWNCGPWETLLVGNPATLLGQFLPIERTQRVDQKSWPPLLTEQQAWEPSQQLAQLQSSGAAMINLVQWLMFLMVV